MKNGFSLIELMVALAIMAILTAVSGQVFSDNIIKSRRQDAQRELLQYTLLQGQFRLTHGHYGSAEELGLEHSEYYKFATDVDGGVTFILSAKAQNNQTKDTNCSTLTINQSMQRDPDGCW